MKSIIGVLERVLPGPYAKVITVVLTVLSGALAGTSLTSCTSALTTLNSLLQPEETVARPPLGLAPPECKCGPA